MSADLEQHFILRVPNPDLANKLRGWLRDQTNIDGQMSLVFEASEFPYACLGCFMPLKQLRPSVGLLKQHASV